MSGQTYTTVGTVSSSALLGGLVDLDVLDDEGAGVKTLGIGVGLGVLQELQEELGGLDGPSGAGDTPLLACTSCSVSLGSVRDDNRDLIPIVSVPWWYLHRSAMRSRISKLFPSPIWLRSTTPPSFLETSNIASDGVFVVV